MTTKKVTETCGFDDLILLLSSDYSLDFLDQGGTRILRRRSFGQRDQLLRNMQPLAVITLLDAVEGPSRRGGRA